MFIIPIIPFLPMLPIILFIPVLPIFPIMPLPLIREHIDILWNILFATAGHSAAECIAGLGRS